MTVKSTELNSYETVTIFKSELSEEQESAVIGRVEEIIKQFKGNVVKFEPWGKKRLAYAINKNLKGKYFYWQYEALSDVVSELERNLKLNDNILRFLTIRLTPAGLKKLVLLEQRGNRESEVTGSYEKHRVD